MSVCPFDILFEWNAKYEEGEILEEYVVTPLRGYDGNDIDGTSVLREEIDSVGMDYFFNLKDEPLTTGVYRIKGCITYSQDYYGDWDSEYDFSYFEKVKRGHRA